MNESTRDVRPLRRLARRLFTLCSLVLVALWIVLVALWVRSYWVNDQLEWRHSNGFINVGPSRGGIWYSGFTGMAGTGPPTGYRSVRPPGRDPTTNIWRFAGFHYWHGPFPAGGTMTIVRLPMWALLAGHLALSIFLFRRLPQHDEARGTLCRSCGYDLRASPERCPECGAAAVSAP